MDACNDICLMTTFPDFTQPGFNIVDYNKRFKQSNVIIHAFSKEVSYPEHWGPLSVKCAFNGDEYYECNGRFYTVTEDNYLVFNDGQVYSSYIHSTTNVESFTINFSPGFQQSVLHSFLYDFDGNNIFKLSSYNNLEFIEKLYTHNKLVSPLLMKLYHASVRRKPDHHYMTELYYALLENLFRQQHLLKKEIKKVNAVKYSTRLELYKRLNYAKDFINSCYMTDISLDRLASVACMDTAHFLRAFKKYFGLTPYQYIIMQRLQAAKRMLETTSYTITEICFAVGYEDTSSFAKLFKKNFLVTPGEYQSMHAKKSIFTC